MRIVKKKDISIMGIKIISFALLCFFIIDIIMATHVTAKPGDDGGKVILIDPGHGGIDGGAVSRRGVLEKDINLDISLKLKEELKKKGYNVLMTREEDKGLYTENGTIRKKKLEDLENRCLMKDKVKSDVFISIHLNIFPQSQYFGAQVWYAKNDESRHFARILQSNLKKDLIEGNNRVEKPALDGYKVLRCSDNASVLVECGFLSNAAEAEMLINKEYQDKIAQTIAKSVEEYYLYMDKIQKLEQ